MKSYVTCLICPICGESTGTLLLDRRMKDTFEMHTVDTTNVCDKCKEQHLKSGVMFINPDTGDLFVIKEEAARKMLHEAHVEFPEKRIVFIDEGIVKMLKRVQEQS